MYKFATDYNDPYYVLGIQRNTDIVEVKKAFYKLANQYHPDKIGDDPDSANKFLFIKQAYQSIKMQKGLMKPAGYVYDNDVKSMRPDPTRFDTDDEENRKSQSDYRMYQEKAQTGGQDYEHFKGTFKTLNDINDVKIRVEEGEMKDSTNRFNLEAVRAKLQLFSNNSKTVYLIIAVAAVIFLHSQLNSQNQIDQKLMNASIEKQQDKQKKRRIFDEEQLKQQKMKKIIEDNTDVKEYLRDSKRSVKRKGDIETGENSV